MSNPDLVCSEDGKHMEKVETIILTIWFIFVSIFSPLWFGGIYMNITGHGKGYAYNTLHFAGKMLSSSPVNVI